MSNVDIQYVSGACPNFKCWPCVTNCFHLFLGNKRWVIATSFKSMGKHTNFRIIMVLCLHCVCWCLLLEISNPFPCAKFDELFPTASSETQHQRISVAPPASIRASSRVLEQEEELVRIGNCHILISNEIVLNVLVSLLARWSRICFKVTAKKVQNLHSDSSTAAIQ